VVAERVVDLLEPVEVEHDDGERLAAFGRKGDSLRGCLAEEVPVREPGEVVVQRLVAVERGLTLQLLLGKPAPFLGLLLLGEVEEDAVDEDRLPVLVVDGAPALPDPADLAATMEDPIDGLERTALLDLPMPLEVVLGVLGVDDAGVASDAVLDEVCSGITGDPLDRVGEEQHRVVGIEATAVDGAGDVGDEPLELPLRRVDSHGSRYRHGSPLT
jgi:hypothetical protein